MREKLAIAIMALIGTVYYQKQAPYNARQLAGRLGIGSEACDKVIKDLLEAKLLLKTADEPPALIPAYSLERMLVQDAVNAVRVSGESRGLNPLAMMSPAAAQQAFERLEDGVQDSLQGLSVKDLISQNDNSQDHDHDHDQSVAGQEQSSGPEDANVRKLTNS
jgi:hypothetical protein